MPHVYEEIYAIVQRIPRGRVLTYGVISHMIGGRMSAQGVGWALKALGAKKKNQSLQNGKDVQKSICKPKGKAQLPAYSKSKVKSRSRKPAAEAVFDFNSVPWQRVVNSQGGTSTWKIPDIPPDLQRTLLEAEGIVFDEEGKMDLGKYVWVDGIAGDVRVNKTVARKQQRS